MITLITFRPSPRSLFLPPLLALLTFLPGMHPLDAAVLTVDAQANNAPYHKIQSALDQAQAGDTVHVKPGIYRERVTFRNSGRQDAPVTLEGEPGAIIDGSTAVSLDWQPAPEIGPGVYKLPVPFFPFTISANGRLLTTISEKRTTPDPTKQQPRHNGWANYEWPKVFGGEGIGPSGWEGVGGLAMYREETKELIVRFKDELDPRTMEMTLAPREACITIKGQNYGVVRGFTLRYATFGVKATDSIGTIVEQCIINAVDNGIELGAGAANCIIRENEISYQPYADASYTATGQWDNWQACKTAGYSDRRAVFMNVSNGGHRIHDNYIHDVWDGVDFNDSIYTANKPPLHGGTAQTNADVEVDHNYFYRVFDDALETFGPGARARIHHNVLQHCRCAFRIKAPTLGPIFGYRNFFIDNGEDHRNWGEVSFAVPYDPASITAEVWLYQNTSTSNAAVTMNFSPEPISDISRPNYHYFNNLFWCQRWVDKNKKFPNPNWKADGNVFVRAADQAPRPWLPPITPEASERNRQQWEDGMALAAQCSMEAHSLWVDNKPPGFVDAAKGDFALNADSVARGRGVDLSKVKTIDGMSLPGTGNGAQPDAGAIPFGEQMPAVPRSHKDVAAEATGTQR